MIAFPACVKDGMVSTAPRRIEINDRRRVVAAPLPIVSGHRPEVATFGATKTRLGDGRLGLINKQLG